MDPDRDLAFPSSGVDAGPGDPRQEALGTHPDGPVVERERGLVPRPLHFRDRGIHCGDVRDAKRDREPGGVVEPGDFVAYRSPKLRADEVHREPMSGYADSSVTKASTVVVPPSEV